MTDTGGSDQATKDDIAVEIEARQDWEQDYIGEEITAAN
jgi:hypothetical protein